MNSPIILTLMVLLPQVSLESANVYQAVLSALRAERLPGKTLVLDTRIAVERCYPHCKQGNYAGEHPVEVVNHLQSRAAINSTCRPSEARYITCKFEQNEVVVSLMPVRIRKDAAQVKLVYWAKTDDGELYGRGLVVELRRGPDGWEVVSMKYNWRT